MQLINLNDACRGNLGFISQQELGIKSILVLVSEAVVELDGCGGGDLIGRIRHPGSVEGAQPTPH